MVAFVGGGGNRHLRTGGDLAAGNNRTTRSIGGTQGKRTVRRVGEGDGGLDLLVLHLYRDREVRHGEGVEVGDTATGIGLKRSRYRFGGRTRAVNLRVTGSHSVAVGGGDGNRHLGAGMQGRRGCEGLTVRRDR